MKQLSEVRRLVASSLAQAQQNEQELKTLRNHSSSQQRFPTQNSSKGFRTRPEPGVSCSQLANNRHKSQKQLTPSNNQKDNSCLHNATTLSFNNLRSSFSKDCNNSVIKGTNNSDYCKSNQNKPRIICYEERAFSEEPNR